MVTAARPDNSGTLESSDARGPGGASTRAAMVDAAALLVLGIGALDGGSADDAAAYRHRAEHAMAAVRP